MPPHPPPLRSVRSRRGGGGVVTLDPLAAASHPDAVVTGVLLAVITLLVVEGLIGLLGPVISLDLFHPDLGLADLFRSLTRIAVSVMALLGAGLGLARHPLFPRLFMAVAAGLTLLISLTLSLLLVAHDPAAGFDLFDWLGIPVILAVPYVVFSRKCRLIFRRHLDINDLKDMKSVASWEVPVPIMPAAVPSVPAEEQVRPHPPRRPRTRRTTAAPTPGPGPGPSAGAENPPQPNAPNAALWAALYGKPEETAAPIDESANPNDAQGGANKRVGLEALVNLRPPGT